MVSSTALTLVVIPVIYAFVKGRQLSARTGPKPRDAGTQLPVPQNVVA
jgi:hypothetical protein